MELNQMLMLGVATGGLLFFIGFVSWTGMNPFVGLGPEPGNYKLWGIISIIGFILFSVSLVLLGIMNPSTTSACKCLC
jgi:hypothetical protein